MIETIWSKGHPVRLRKADIKNTKKCKIIKNALIDNEFVIEYESGISHGVARFPNTETGIMFKNKFLKLLER